MSALQRTPYPSLEVMRLGRAEWRVSEASDSHLLLGFIERQSRDRFEVLWMSDPIRWGYTTSFDSALIAFGDTAKFTGDVASERERPASPRATQRAFVLSSSAHRSTWSKDVAEH